MQILTWVLVVVVCLGLAFGAASAFGAWQWSVATRDLVAQLRSGRVSPPHKPL